MATNQQTLLLDKPVIDLNFLDNLKTTKEESIGTIRDLDTALGELQHIRMKKKEIETLREKAVAQVELKYNDAITVIDDFAGQVETKITAFVQGNKTTFTKDEDALTGEITFSKVLEHGSVTVVQKESIKLGFKKEKVS